MSTPLQYFEAFTSAKDPDAPGANEDQIVIVPGIACAVIDGSTDISGLRHNDVLGQGATGGCLAARAMAQALRNFAAAPFAGLPDAAVVAGALSEAVGALYERLGRLAAAREAPANRFRATFAGAFVAGGTMRLIAIGDSGIRVNGRQVLARQFPGDIVLSRARAEAWHLLTGRGVTAEEARAAVRALIVRGLDTGGPDMPAGLDAGDLRDIAARTQAHPEVQAIDERRPGFVQRILAAGLQGIRAAPEVFEALVIDGISDVSGAAAVLDMPATEVKTLEIFSDGYPLQPAACSVAAWEAALAEVDRADPERVGAFPSTKGRVDRKFFDDRSIVIARQGAEPTP